MKSPALICVTILFGLQSLAQAPLEHVGAPLERHAVTNRGFQGISSMAVAPNGRLWATWYGGHTPGEDHNNYAILATSGDDGKTWQEKLIVDPDGPGPRRAFDVEIWVSPDGKLRWFWSDRVTPNKNVKSDVLWMMTLDNPNAADTPWHQPVPIAKGVMMCKPIALTTGEWALPVCEWYADKSSLMVVSTDGGKTFSVRGGAGMPKEDRTFDEHNLVERKDGSIWCLARTKSGIREAFSTDRGKTWSQLEPSAILHPSARFFIQRLQSGNLLLIKHGPIAERIGRSHLTAYISCDDGKTWEGGLMLDERAGVSYPDGQQAANGTIYVTHDFDRYGQRHILFSTFKEEDALAGKPVSDAVRLRQLISEGSGGIERQPITVNANADGASLSKEAAGRLAGEGFESVPLAIGTKLFTDRTYTCAEIPDALKQLSFVRLPLSDKQTLRCIEAGMIYVLTPEPERNKDTLSQALKQQGFQKVALPEVRLFDPRNRGNFCTLYQKSCKVGESVVIGKWGVPLVK